MKLVRVIRNLKGSNLYAVVEDNGGTLRKIQFSWMTKDGSKAPVPDVWIEAINAETIEARRKSELGSSLFDIG